jgi:multicomponent Na+:H+ antiporter subunit E
VTRRLSTGHVAALSLWLVLLWLMLWADISVANVVSGVLVAIVVVALTRRIAVPYPDAGGYQISPIGLVVFVAHVVWSLVKSNLFLAWEIVTPTNTIATGTVEVPLRSTSPAIAMAVSNVVTLTPGTVTVGVADDSSMLVIAVLHLADPDEVRSEVRRTEQLAIRAFGSRTAREVLAAEGAR